jgi:hypothetical protein
MGQNDAGKVAGRQTVVPADPARMYPPRDRSSHRWKKWFLLGVVFFFFIVFEIAHN